MKKMEVIRCLSCGSSMVDNIGNNIGMCQHCSSTMLLPRQDEEIVALLNTAYVYRENYNYDLAIKSYQFVLEKDSNELSAYEGILLSKYGIEYVKDSYTGKLIPTCHRAHFKSIFEDEYYKTLIALSNDEQKQVIEKKAKEIDVLQKSIERQLKNEQDYDIFISYKASDKDGNKTEDSIIAREIYDELTKKNYRVFLAEKSLENRLGSEYEPIIFKALHSSSIFILVGTSKENIESNWVRNEWSRFIDRIKNNDNLPKGCFIPVFKGMNPYDMPKINNTFVQGVDASKLGYTINIIDGVSKILKPESEQKIINALDDYDNFVEFEKIQKKRSKELKKKRWKDLLKSKGPKKYFYLLFLYSPYLLGALSLIFSFLIPTRFSKEPEFAIFIAFVIALLTMSIITMQVQRYKFGINPFIQIIIPFSLVAISISSYLICLFCIPLDSTGRPANSAGWSWAKYHNGIIYTDEIPNQATISNIIPSEVDKYIKKVDGKKYLMVPETIKGENVWSVSIDIPKDVNAVVYPKNVDNIQVGFLEIPSKTIEIYVYQPTSIDFHLSTKDSESPINNPEVYKYIKLYHEGDKEIIVNNGSGSSIYPKISYPLELDIYNNVSQIDLPFYD